MDSTNDDASKIRAEIEEDFSKITPIIYNCLIAAQQTVPECMRTILENCGYDNGECPQELADKYNQVKRQLKAHLYRATTQILLQSHGVNTKAVNEKDKQSPIDWERSILSNNGLSGSYADRNYKILKALWKLIFDEQTDEFTRKIGVPLPGISKARRQYFRQLHRGQYMLDALLDGEAKLPKYNAVYLWDDPTPNILNLYLACTSWCDDYHVATYFIVPIPHPLLTMKPEITPNEIIEEIELPRIDLELGLKLSKSELEDEDNSDESDGESDDESDKNDNLF